MNTFGVGTIVMLLALGLAQTTCQHGGDRQPRTPAIDPAPVLGLPAPPVAIPSPPTPRAAETSSVMVYIKLVIDKKYNLLARLVGGKRNSIWQRTTYDAANPWWNNPLIAYAEPPFLDADVIGRADADVITGRGASGNVLVRLTMVPHADVAIKTSPSSDAMKGKATGLISTVAEFYDGRWVEMVREESRRITFEFDTCDPLQNLEVIGHESRAIPTFALERYTRDEEKWEPRINWPEQFKSGDWRVVIYGSDATIEVTSYRYVQQSVAGAQR